ncbi:MAG: DUF5681 domain-containing protein [Pseudomonadota bacterium]
MSDGNKNNDKPRYKEGNTLPDGSYEVGKNKPPVATRFQKGDGRKRGRRKKGTSNFRTDFQQELDSKVSLSVNGKKKRVTRQRAIVMRLMDNASRGKHPAIRQVMDYADRYGLSTHVEPDNEAEPMPGLTEMTDEELQAFGPLLRKAMGLEPEPETEPHPLAYLSDPDDRRNYQTHNFIDGVSIEVCDIDTIPDRILNIDSRAYCHAMFAARPTCFDRPETGAAQ